MMPRKSAFVARSMASATLPARPGINSPAVLIASEEPRGCSLFRCRFESCSSVLSRVGTDYLRFTGSPREPIWCRAQRRTRGLYFLRMTIDIATLSPEERLKLLEQLWDSLSSSPSAVPLTKPQRDELDRRLDELDREGPVGIPWEEVYRRISSRRA